MSLDGFIKPSSRSLPDRLKVNLRRFAFLWQFSTYTMNSQYSMSAVEEESLPKNWLFLAERHLTRTSVTCRARQEHSLARRSLWRRSCSCCWYGNMERSLVPIWWGSEEEIPLRPQKNWVLIKKRENLLSWIFWKTQNSRNFWNP